MTCAPLPIPPPSSAEPPAPNKSKKKSVRQVRRKATVTEARRGTKGSKTACPHARANLKKRWLHACVYSSHCLSETAWVCRAVAHARAQPVRCSCPSAAHARSRVVHVSDSLFVTGDAVWSHCFAQRGASRRRLPTLRDSVTPLPPTTLCRPTTGAWQGDSETLALLSLPGEKNNTLGRGLL